MNKLIKTLLKKYSRSELATAAGYRTSQSIRNIEAGIMSMPIHKQKNLATALNIPIEKIMKAHLADIRAKY